MGDGRLAGDHPVLLRMMAQCGQLMAEHGRLGEGAAALGGASRTPAVVRSKINALQAEERMKDSNHPQHKEALAEWNMLIEQLGNEPLEPGGAELV